MACCLQALHAQRGAWRLYDRPELLPPLLLVSCHASLTHRSTPRLSVQATALATIGKFVIKKKVGEKEAIFGSVTAAEIVDAIRMQVGARLGVQSRVLSRLLSGLLAAVAALPLLPPPCRRHRCRRRRRCCIPGALQCGTLEVFMPLPAMLTGLPVMLQTARELDKRAVTLPEIKALGTYDASGA